MACRVMGSRSLERQFDYAVAKVVEFGLSDRVKIEMYDYRAIRKRLEATTKLPRSACSSMSASTITMAFRTCPQAAAPRGLYSASRMPMMGDPRPLGFENRRVIRK